MTRPAWLVPGAAVVEFTPERRTHGGTIVETTIARVLARDVVLANGQRYNADRLSKRSGSSWSPDTVLLPSDDPRVDQARESNRLGRAASAAATAAEKLTRAVNEYRYGLAGFGAVDEQLRALTAALDIVRTCRP